MAGRPSRSTAAAPRSSTPWSPTSRPVSTSSRRRPGTATFRATVPRYSPPTFSYAVYDAGGRYLGCCYRSPVGRRTPLSEELLAHDVDVSWWVTEEAYAQGVNGKLHAALQAWIAERFPFRNPHYSNRELP